MRFFSKKDEKTFLVIARIKEFISFSLQSFREAFFELDHGSEKMVSTRNLEHIETIGLYFSDLSG